MLVFLFSIPENSIAQDHLTGTRELLMKYWYYRERLKKDFMQFADPWKRGSSEPASIRRHYEFGTSQNIKWGDGTIDLGIYIGVLATEYKLLVNAGENTDETIKELYFALRTLDRLDLYAEGACIRDDPNSYNSPQFMNGFFMRDEIGAGLFYNNNYSSPNSEFGWFENILNSFGSEPVSIFQSDYVSHRIRANGGALEESKDQVVYLMEGLLLVLKLIPDDVRYIINDISTNYIPTPAVFEMSTNTSYLKAQAWWRIKKIMDFIHPPSDGWTVGKFDIINPVSGSKVELGKNFWSWAPAFSDIYFRVTGGTSNPDANVLDFFNPVQRAFRYACKKQYRFQQKYFPLIYSTFDMKDNIHLFLRLNILARQASPEYTSFNSCLFSEYKFYHLPLLHFVLNDEWGIPWPCFNCNYSNADYQNLLLQAPCKGPWIGAGNYGSYNWSSTSLIVHPQRRGQEIFPGEFNGLDYMLIHNLLLLTNFNSTNADMKNLYKAVVKETMPWNRNGALGNGVQNNRIYIPSYTSIDASNTINSNGFVTYRAEESINLNTGFYVNQGADFYAYIDDIDCINKTDLYKTQSIKTPQSNQELVAINDRKVICYPSPAEHELNFSSPDFTKGKVEIEIADLLGRKVKYFNQYISENGVIKCNVGELPQGIYVYKIINNGLTFSSKFHKISTK
jgi:hypothetical protein